MMDSGHLGSAAPAGPDARVDGWTSRFAPRATPAFDAWFAAELAAMADEVADAIGPSFRGLVLGGGYGRGEGGVVVRDGVERPYNDIDLFLFVDRPRGLRPAALEAVRLRYHARLGVDVDFSRPYHPSEIARWRPTLMWHELAAGHVVLKGCPALIDVRCPPAVRDTPPVAEALRLLLNRGAGLLWAMRVADGCEPTPDPDFVRRNYYKCLLACGDALLLADGTYGQTFASRSDRLATLPAARHMRRRGLLFDGYAAARRFKLAPHSPDLVAPSRAQLEDAAALWAETLLTVEWARTGRRWASVHAYARWGGRREDTPSSTVDALRCLARNLRRGRVSLRHPREPLYQALPGLLTGAGGQGTSWPAASANFLDRWRVAQ